MSVPSASDRPVRPLNSVKKRGSHGALRSQLPTIDSQRCCAAFTPPRQRERPGGFTLLELLIVIGLIAILLVLVGPAFTTMKSGSDVTSAIYEVKGLLENARAYAKTNHSYVFVGFSEVDSSIDASVSPQISTADTPYGRVSVAVVASKDGTSQYHYATTDQGTDWKTNSANGAHRVAGGKSQTD